MNHVIGETLRRHRPRARPTNLAWMRGGAMDPVRQVLRGTTVQAKLKVGAANDSYEQEADRVAARVVAMPEPSIAATATPMGVQRTCAGCEEKVVRRQPLEEEEAVQAKLAPGPTPELGPGLQSRISGLRGGGKPLPATARSFFEPRFGADFSQVRIHTDGRSAALAKAINAHAFTFGRDIVFGRATYAPESSAGRRLMAHELTHVMQQTQGGEGPAMRARPDDLYVGAEQPTWEAKEAASRPKPPGTGIGHGAVVQRLAKFDPGRESPEINLAEHFLAERPFTGITPPVLNKKLVLTEKEVRIAMDPLIPQTYTKADGTGAAEVNRVPTNKGSFVAVVPTKGPWSAATDKAKAAFLIRRFKLNPPLACLLPGPTTLTIYGKPTQAGFEANARTHESLHARDHETGFNSVIDVWDTKIQAAFDTKAEFTGPTEAAAEAALHTAMGGTAKEIAKKQHDRWVALDEALHKAGTTVANGGTATGSSVAAGPSCTTVSIDLI